jgi:hypothetical protein
MRFHPRNSIVCASAFALSLITSGALGQVVINELVTDERSGGSGQISDTRQFIELYNAGGATVDIGSWTIDSVLLDDGSPFTSDLIPASTMLAPGDFYVVGQSAVPNVDLDLGATAPWPNDNAVYELRDSGASLVDAVAVNITFDPQLANATAQQLTQIGTGVWGQSLSANTGFSQSLARYVDGRDTDVNGYDFGFIPFTPGTSNNLPQQSDYTPPNVDGLSRGTTVPGFGGSFVLPKVIDPTIVDGNNRNAIPASPQGGNAIVAWDGTGGGNMNHSDSLVTSFDLYAYLDTSTLGISAGSGDAEWESTIYGIGTTDPFFAHPDPAGRIDPLLASPFGTTNNGSTGVGWLYQRIELDTVISEEVAQLLLVDFNDGGDSLPAGNDWTVIQTFDMTGLASDWHRLGIDYDPNTGSVTARLDDQTFNFTTSTDLIGTFYAGYREALSGGVPAVVRPATFDVIELASMPGDFDGDGDVDGQDFLEWQRSDGTPAGLTAWTSNYGFGAVAAASSIPEPSSMMLISLAGFGLVGARRRPFCILRLNTEAD